MFISHCGLLSYREFMSMITKFGRNVHQSLCTSSTPRALGMPKSATFIASSRFLHSSCSLACLFMVSSGVSVLIFSGVSSIFLGVSSIPLSMLSTDFDLLGSRSSWSSETPLFILWYPRGPGMQRLHRYDTHSLHPIFQRISPLTAPIPTIAMSIMIMLSCLPYKSSCCNREGNLDYNFPVVTFVCPVHESC